MGPYGSHQVLATAVFGRLAGFRTRALLTPQPDVAEIELNRRLLPLLRMEVMRCGSFAAVPLTLVKARFKALAGSRPYWVPPRSEEHTSELQSLMRTSYAVFCLKKKKTKCTRHNTQE